MMQLDYTFERQLEMEREESREEAREEGREEGYVAGREELLTSMLCSGKTPDEVVSFTGVPKNEVERVYKTILENKRDSETDN